MSVRPLRSQAEFEAAVTLQEQVWGADIRETVPACLLQVSQEVGGIAAGAFTPAGELVGFVFGLTGPRRGKLAHWSHMLAVAIAWRNRGVGKVLKYYQREQLLKIDVDSMYWTFDPLESRNAHVNLNKLGAVVDEYVPNFYGENPVAITDTGIGTDRFVVCWDLLEAGSPQGLPDLDGLNCHVISLGEGAEVPEIPESVSPLHVRVEVPADIQSLKSVDPEAGAAWRVITRRAFEHYLGRGYHVAGFSPGPQGRGGWYTLAPPND